MLEQFLDAQAALPKGGHRWWWDHSGLTAEQKDAVQQAFARPDVSDKAVQVVLASWGVKVTKQQIGHLRRRLADG